MRNSALKEKLLTEDDSKLKITDVVNRIYAAERAVLAAKDLSGATAVEVNKVFHKQKSSFHKGKITKREPSLETRNEPKCAKGTFNFIWQC
jgi:hypothetical protein